jgi:hypothetical protein
VALQLINVGTYSMDATGFVLRTAFVAINSMFTELFGLASLGSPLLINVGSGPNSTPPGDDMPVTFNKINSNFGALFVAAGHPSYQEIISEGGGPGMVVGQYSPVIGTGYPGRVAMIQCNNNFVYLYHVF